MAPTLQAVAFLFLAAPAALLAQAPEGKRVYDEHCAICHAADGRGRLPYYPALADDPSIESKPAVDAIRMVLNGGYRPGTRQDPMPHGMPPFAQALSDAEVASVVTYIRTAWG